MRCPVKRSKTRFEIVPIAQVPRKIASCVPKERVEKLSLKREPYAVPVQPAGRRYDGSSPQ